MITFLDSFDLIRFMAGLLIAEFMFAINSAPKRNHFWIRAISGFVFGLAFAQIYLLLQWYFLSGGSFIVFGVIGGLWWTFLTFISAFYLIFCFKMGICGALYRVILGTLIQHIATVIVRYWLVRTLFPTLPEDNTLLYIAITLLIYVCIYLLTYFLLVRYVDNESDLSIVENKRNLMMYLLMIVILSIISSLCGGVVDWVVTGFKDVPELSNIRVLLQYFCIGVSILYCIAFLIFNIQFSMVSTLRREKQFQSSVMAEKSRQYELSKSSIEIINRRCHDLKHQIKALRFAKEEEKNELFSETEKAIMIYDCGINTDNEVLNVLLTEKSLYCLDRNIRLSCNINTQGIDKIQAIDLYTMLGNAIDNAIESVSELKDPDKRTISINIGTQGGLLYFQIENYYEGKIKFKNGMPLTNKKDKENHGIGLKSIKFIVEKYDGSLLIKNDDGIFILRLIFPING